MDSLLKARLKIVACASSSSSLFSVSSRVISDPALYLPLGSSLKITLPPTLTRFQLPSWQCFRFGSHRSPHPACSQWHIASWDISHPGHGLNNSAHSLPAPCLCHHPTHSCTHMRAWIPDEQNVSESPSEVPWNQFFPLFEAVFWLPHLVIITLLSFYFAVRRLNVCILLLNHV